MKTTIQVTTLTWLTMAVLAIGLLTLTGCESTPEAGGQGMMMPMGKPGDVADANAVWHALESARLAGANARTARPYKGQHPHGAVLETLQGRITVNGHTGMVIVKRNYGGPGVSIDRVGANRAKYLKAVTVMFKRERGYDSDNQDWFWAKFKPDGSLHTNKMKVKLAGRVARGMPQGCISCHRGAGGGDYVFSNTIRVR